MTKLRAPFVDSNDDASIDENIHRLDEHLLSDCCYNPFCLVNIGDDNKFHLASFFMSIRDRFHYQACDRSGTFKNETEHIFCKINL